MAPADMEQALVGVLKAHDQPTPESRGQFIRAVLESLALEYDWRLQAVADLTGKSYQTLYMVGGGTANKLLCQLTADACGIPVLAGIDQCTAVGNTLGQALALGIVKSPAEMRQLSGSAFDLARYEPRDRSAWEDKRARYDKIRQSAG